ncbi:MAG: UDP-N-acetylglucosamine--N-acetylmuramyl-(pentapeptide) pyrophosphoryl-undecaprenol N-acetylglucosamine transferase [Candidatus Andersenbacteria bacterium]
MPLRVALTGGGTGGHTYPVVAVAAAVKQANPQVEFLWIGSGSGPEREVAQQIGVRFVAVPTGKLRRYFSLANLVDIFKVPFGVVEAWFALGRFDPDVLFSKGGFVSYPAVMAAWLHDIPILLHETDAVPGLANRKLASKAALIATSFPVLPAELPYAKSIHTGQPIRRELLAGSAQHARDALKLPKDERLVLAVFGGSQGAVAVNQVIAELLPELLPHYQVIHQVGPDNEEFGRELEQKFGARGYRARGFYTDELADVYAVADVIVSRAGGQLHELAALGKPTVLLPLPGSASDHQVKNADALAKQHAAVMLEAPNLTSQLMLQTLLKLRHDEGLRRQLGANIKRVDQPRAADKIAYWLLRLAELR